MHKLIAANKENESNVSTRIELIQQARHAMIDRRSSKVN